ncbi:MAG: c-type cytochrome [Alphaproteobacteria bacterium]|nr:c-type cytochrome [Alphaproteobacteria bacterium]
MRSPSARAAFLAAILALLAPTPAGADLRGHGGPVKALAVTGDGTVAISGSFDSTAILWSLADGRALAVLRFHNGVVNAVAALPDGRFATAGEDGRIALWRADRPAPVAVILGHSGPIASLAVSPDGASLASASWDTTVRVTPLAGGDARVLTGHAGNVNGVAFAPSGRALASAGYDATFRIWPLDRAGPPRIVQTAAPLNAVAATADAFVAAGVDGVIRIFDRSGAPVRDVLAQQTPVIALGLDPAGARIAAASVTGEIAVIELATGTVLQRLLGPERPLWSLAFVPARDQLLSGDNARVVRRWDLKAGALIGFRADDASPDPLAAFKDDPGAQVFRACIACHTLEPDGGNRAGPSLHGVFGRRIATAAGYDFSPALRSLDIVWNAQTIARLFEIGPNAYTPGTKMPEQTLSAGERAALVEFLERATAPR